MGTHSGLADQVGSCQCVTVGACVCWLVHQAELSIQQLKDCVHALRCASAAPGRLYIVGAVVPGLPGLYQLLLPSLPLYQLPGRFRCLCHLTVLGLLWMTFVGCWMKKSSRLGVGSSRRGPYGSADGALAVAEPCALSQHTRRTRQRSGRARRAPILLLYCFLNVEQQGEVNQYG